MNEIQDATVFEDAKSKAQRDSENAEFLLKEGLDLLSSFRAIEDKAVRAQVKTLVDVLALAGRA